MNVISTATCALGDRVLKVNHAGEHGAVNLYAGQLAVGRWLQSASVLKLVEFKTHEESHRAIFAAELQRRNLRRCRSYVLCGIGGYVIGVVTALLGQQAIAAATVAVESVVLQHLQQQIANLTGQDDAAVATINMIVREEQDHHDQATILLDPECLIAKIVTTVVTSATETVIWLGMRL